MTTNSLAQEFIREAGGPEKLSAAFLARQLEQYDEAGDADRANAVMHLLVEAARDENLTLVTDTIQATNLRLAPAFVGVLMSVEDHPSLDPLLDAIHLQVPAEKALLLLSKACSAFGSDWKHRPLMKCATIVERLGEELVTRQGRDDLGVVAGDALLCKARALYVGGETEAAVEASDQAVWFIGRSSFFGGSLEVNEQFADACVLHAGLLVQVDRLDDAHFYLAQANETFVELLNAGKDTADKMISTFRNLEKVLTKSKLHDGAAICRRAAENISASLAKERKGA